MADKQYFERVNAYTWELPKWFDARMQVPARLYCNEQIFDLAFRDKSIQQLINVAMLPGIVKYAMAMPDVHQGYGFPIGGVAAFRYDGGIISPGGVGYDINCGVRMLASTVRHEELAPYLEELLTVLYQNCPSGVGGKGAVRLSQKDLERVLERGSEWALAEGYAERADLVRTEDGGSLAGARADAVPPRAKERGRPQLGSLGAGNHFLEIDVVDEIYAPDVAQTFGLVQGCVVVQIHCGSRGLGHEVCSQYLRRLQGAPARYGFTIPDRELVAAPLDSPEGRDYLAAMFAAANYAFANRQVLAHCARRSFEKVLAGKVRDWRLRQVYDVTHNIAKIERHRVAGQEQRVIVHRKGATRAFAPGHPDLPEVYRQTGQPVLVPGSMGTASYVLAGAERAMEETFGSTCHGAGRMMSRRQAKRSAHGEDVRAALRRQGVMVRSGSMRGLAEEMPQAYKDVSLVVESVVGAGLARRVARVRPLAVIKG
ncbi:MAG: RNA-splicing ligase RtcB [Chloroflexi bacterium]|nr:MAG: RNA-splicing ligase RtcB [Chloroflexota bacterium]